MEHVKKTYDGDGWSTEYEVPGFLYEDQRVLVRYEGTSAVWCKVVVACGDGGRVVNERHGVDRWVKRYDMRVVRQPEPKPDDEPRYFDGSERPLTEDEKWVLGHIGMWGSAAYPLNKFGAGKWSWGPIRGIKGPPTIFKTKKAATASFEAYLDTLRHRHAWESYKRAVAEQADRFAAQSTQET